VLREGSLPWVQFNIYLLGSNNFKFGQIYLFDSGQSFPPCFKLKSFIGPVALFYLVQSPNFFNIPSRLDSPVDTLNNIAKQKQSNVEKLFSFNDIFSNYLGKAQVPI